MCRTATSKEMPWECSVVFTLNTSKQKSHTQTLTAEDDDDDQRTSNANKVLSRAFVIVPSCATTTSSSTPSLPWLAKLHATFAQCYTTAGGDQPHTGADSESAAQDALDAVRQMLPLPLGSLPLDQTLVPLAARSALLSDAGGGPPQRHWTVEATLVAVTMVAAASSIADATHHVDTVAIAMRAALAEADGLKQAGNDAFRQASQQPALLQQCIRHYKKATEAATSVLALHTEKTVMGSSTSGSVSEDEECCSRALEVAVTSVSNMALCAIRMMEAPALGLKRRDKTALARRIAGRCRRALHLLTQRPPVYQLPRTGTQDAAAVPAAQLLTWKLLHRSAKVLRLGDEEDGARSQLVELHASLRRFVAHGQREAAAAADCTDIVATAEIAGTIALLQQECAAVGGLRLDPIAV